jgi:hypothetical protein
MAAATNGSLFGTNAVPVSVIAYTAVKAVKTAHINEQGLDIIQIVNQGGSVVWNLDATGTVHVNPVNASKVSGHFRAALAQYFGSSLAAIPNPNKLDIYQCHDGSRVVFHVDYLGNAFAP